MQPPQIKEKNQFLDRCPRNVQEMSKKKCPKLSLKLLLLPILSISIKVSLVVSKKSKKIRDFRIS
jgi:hypothetical protein